MQPVEHDIPKHHQERTWAIYGKSVPQLFIERVAARPDAVALRYKDFGLYQEVTWRKYLNDVKSFALGLIALGISPAIASRSWVTLATNISSPTWRGSRSARSPTASTRPAHRLKFGTNSKTLAPNFSSRKTRNTSTRSSNSTTSQPIYVKSSSLTCARCFFIETTEFLALSECRSLVTVYTTPSRTCLSGASPRSNRTMSPFLSTLLVPPARRRPR